MSWPPRLTVRRDPTFCPLCGFFLPNDLDGHFVPCLVRRTQQVTFADQASPSPDETARIDLRR